MSNIKEVEGELKHFVFGKKTVGDSMGWSEKTAPLMILNVPDEDKVYYSLSSSNWKVSEDIRVVFKEYISSLLGDMSKLSNDELSEEVLIQSLICSNDEDVYEMEDLYSKNMVIVDESEEENSDYDNCIFIESKATEYNVFDVDSNNIYLDGKITDIDSLYEECEEMFEASYAVLT